MTTHLSAVPDLDTEARPTDEQLLAKYRPVLDRIRAASTGHEEGRLSLEEARWLRDAGYTALRVPRELGGDGASLRQLFLLTTELAAADSNLPHALRIHFRTTEDHWRQRHEGRAVTWLRRIGEGTVIGTAVSERTGEFRRPATTLRRDGDRLLLSGTKYYSTGALYADVLTVSATREGGDVVTALVPTDAAGVELVDDWAGFGQRGSASGTSVFTDVEVAGEEDVFPPPTLDRGRAAHLQLTHLATVAGIVRRATDEVAEFVRRRQRAYPQASAAVAAQDPLVQQVVGRADAVASSLRSIVLDAAGSLDRAAEAQHAYLRTPEEDRTPAERDRVATLELEAELHAYRAQSVVLDLALRTTSEIFEVGGSSALDRAHGLDRHWRNVRTLASHNPLIYRERQVGEHVLTGAVPSTGSPEDVAPTPVG